ncbi:LytTR family transcriptional regulator DNA-binding domain-containing protein [Enterococcus columbae]|uniref:LytTR family transcriptional regulator DNA-binding domain-containing protein n=1 Tax=Enterococcus columbae TaxID=1355 RepID=UPI0009DACCAF
MGILNVLQKLDNSFIQIHKSYIINVKYIEIAHHEFVQCKLSSIYDSNNIDIPYGRKFKETARNTIFELL